MNAMELQYLIFELLNDRLVKDVDAPEAFVGIQGDHVIVLVKGGEHLGVTVVPARAEVAG